MDIKNVMLLFDMTYLSAFQTLTRSSDTITFL